MDIDFKERYFKYKNKYLELKKQYGGVTQDDNILIYNTNIDKYYMEYLKHNVKLLAIRVYSPLYKNSWYQFTRTNSDILFEYFKSKNEEIQDVFHYGKHKFNQFPLDENNMSLVLNYINGSDNNIEIKELHKIYSQMITYYDDDIYMKIMTDLIDTEKNILKDIKITDKNNLIEKIKTMKKRIYELVTPIINSQTALEIFNYLKQKNVVANAIKLEKLDKRISKQVNIYIEANRDNFGEEKIKSLEKQKSLKNKKNKIIDTFLINYFDQDFPPIDKLYVSINKNNMDNIKGVFPLESDNEIILTYPSFIKYINYDDKYKDIIIKMLNSMNRIHPFYYIENENEKKNISFDNLYTLYYTSYLSLKIKQSNNEKFKEKYNDFNIFDFKDNDIVEIKIDHCKEYYDRYHIHKLNLLGVEINGNYILTYNKFIKMIKFNLNKIKNDGIELTDLIITRYLGNYNNKNFDEILEYISNGGKIPENFNDIGPENVEYIQNNIIEDINKIINNIYNYESTVNGIARRFKKSIIDSKIKKIIEMKHRLNLFIPIFYLSEEKANKKLDYFKIKSQQINQYIQNHNKLNDEDKPNNKEINKLINENNNILYDIFENIKYPPIYKILVKIPKNNNNYNNYNKYIENLGRFIKLKDKEENIYITFYEFLRKKFSENKNENIILFFKYSKKISIFDKIFDYLNSNDINISPKSIFMEDTNLYNKKILYFQYFYQTIYLNKFINLKPTENNIIIRERLYKFFHLFGVRIIFKG